MLPIFNYNSRSFTILAIIFLIALAYLSYKDNDHAQTIEPANPAGARYVMEVDPSNPEKTFMEKAILYIFKNDINKSLEQGKKRTAKAAENFYTTKPGDSVAIIYYQTNPKPIFAPTPEEVVIGKNNLPKAVDEMLIGMKLGEKREFKVDGINYRVELVSVAKPVGDK